MNDGSQQHDHPESNLLFLLVALLVSLIVVPFFEATDFDRYLFHVSIMAVLVSALFVNRNRRMVFIAGSIVVMVTVPVILLTLFFDHPYMFIITCVLESVFFFSLAGLLLSSVLRRHLATVESIFGAISIYLLLGLAWAMLYMALERIDNESLDIAHRKVVAQGTSDDGTTAFSQLVYFSFVTMSTLGYGDIVPETPLARTLTWTQSVTGQFYLAVLVAFLVSEFSRRSDFTQSRSGTSDTA